MVATARRRQPPPTTGPPTKMGVADGWGLSSAPTTSTWLCITRAWVSSGPICPAGRSFTVPGRPLPTSRPLDNPGVGTSAYSVGGDSPRKAIICLTPRYEPAVFDWPLPHYRQARGRRYGRGLARHPISCRRPHRACQEPWQPPLQTGGGFCSQCRLSNARGKNSLWY